MPWPTQQKQMSRKRILHSAVELFSARGFDNVSIGDVMENAELTHGGFYAHFSSKQELYAEAVTVAARESALAEFPLEDEADETALLKQLLSGYLAVSHVHQEQPPCPLAFLATDVANRETDVRNAYTKVFKRLAALINKQLPTDTPARRSRALALSAMMIGGVAVSRALNNENTVKSLLEACRIHGEELISGNFE
jgi:TetR/AcrR family transcriptional repressor of nem operon